MRFLWTTKTAKPLVHIFALALMVVLSTFLGYAGLDKLFGTHFLDIIFLAVFTAAAIFELIRRLS